MSELSSALLIDRKNIASYMEGCEGKWIAWEQKQTLIFISPLFHCICLVHVTLKPFLNKLFESRIYTFIL